MAVFSIGHLTQLIRTPLLYYAPIIKHHDLIRLINRAHAVCDNKHRFAPKQLGERSLHLSLAFHIKRCCGFIKKHDWGIFQQRTRNRDTLPLSA